jgi:GNAT superfamily N-acetyltransferase
VITVYPAQPSDAQAIAGLLEELGQFYGTPAAEPLDRRVAQIGQALFADPPAAYALLAREEPGPPAGVDALAGLAAYSFLWPAIGPTRSLYLKELYVPAAYRGRGVGKVLMEAVLEAAGRHGCSRVEWTTDVSNTDAQAFYDRLGLPRYPSKVFYRVEIVHLAASLGARIPGSDHLKGPWHRPASHELSAPGGRYA